MRCAAWNDSSRNAYDFDCDVKDPSFVIHPNGTTVIAYRGVVSAMRAIALQLVNVHCFRMDRDVQTNSSERPCFAVLRAVPRSHGERGATRCAAVERDLCARRRPSFH